MKYLFLLLTVLFLSLMPITPPAVAFSLQDMPGLLVFGLSVFATGFFCALFLMFGTLFVNAAEQTN